MSGKFPQWDKTGEKPQEGDVGQTDDLAYEGGDQLHKKHINYLWYSLWDLEENVAGLDDVSEAKGRVPVVETLDDLPDADNEELGTRYFVEEENQSYEVTKK